MNEEYVLLSTLRKLAAFAPRSHDAESVPVRSSAEYLGYLRRGYGCCIASTYSLSLEWAQEMNYYLYNFLRMHTVSNSGRMIGSKRLTTSTR